MIHLDAVTILTSLGVAFVASLAYFGLLAVIARRMRSWEQKRAMTILLASFPFRLALLGVALVWLVRHNGLVGALAVVPSVWLSRALTNRWVREMDGSE